jgi:dephospho-CoA kinase
MRAIDFVQEGINDPAIFKVIFVIGGPGSGKSYITKRLGLSALGYTTVNSDIAFEYLMKKHVLDPKMPPEQQKQRDIVRQRAKDITADKSALAIDGRLGIVIDGTGDDFEKISKLKNNFDALGYNNFLVVVNTKLDVARERNRQRPRTVPDEIVVDSWYAVQNNIGKFSQIFENIAIIDNSGDSTATESQIQDAYKKIAKFTKQPPNKPMAKQWIEQNRQTNEAAYPGNIGMMEMYKFKQIASPELWAKLKKLIAAGRQQAAWDLIQKVTGTQLK